MESNKPFYVRLDERHQGFLKALMAELAAGRVGDGEARLERVTPSEAVRTCLDHCMGEDQESVARAVEAVQRVG